MKYVAFLRGINVGGNNIIKMDRLRAVFSTMKFTQVSTYIQSGNVVFEAKKQSPPTLEKNIANGLSAEIGYNGKVMVRSAQDMERVVAALPSRSADPEWKTDVLYLSGVLNAEEAVKELKLKPIIEEIHHISGVIFWSVRKDSQSRTAMAKLASHPIYQHVTVRNARTTKKILEIMNSQ